MGFENNYNQDAGTCRVSYAYALMQACGAIDTTQRCQPDVDVSAGGTCNADGQTTNCPDGTADFPMTPACGNAK